MTFYRHSLWRIPNTRQLRSFYRIDFIFREPTIRGADGTLQTDLRRSFFNHSLLPVASVSLGKRILFEKQILPCLSKWTSGDFSNLLFSHTHTHTHTCSLYGRLNLENDLLQENCVNFITTRCPLFCFESHGTAKNYNFISFDSFVLIYV